MVTSHLGEYIFGIIFRALKLVSNCWNSALLMVLIGTESRKVCELFHFWFSVYLRDPLPSCFFLHFACKIFSCMCILCQFLGSRGETRNCCWQRGVKALDRGSGRAVWEQEQRPLGRTGRLGAHGSERGSLLSLCPALFGSLVTL